MIYKMPFVRSLYKLFIDLEALKILQKYWLIYQRDSSQSVYLLEHFNKQKVVISFYELVYKLVN